MPHDPRNVIWSETSQLLYQARYTEELEKALLARWSWLDSITRIVVAIASSGAALTGHVFWKNADYTLLTERLRIRIQDRLDATISATAHM